MGRIIRGRDKTHLEIVNEKKVDSWPWFDLFRGSTSFTLTDEGYLGLVHFSFECYPRHYYHCLVLLDRETMYPIRYSMPFYFHQRSVEFCIGMRVDLEMDKYVFWISQMDSRPEMICVDRTEIVLHKVPNE